MICNARSITDIHLNLNLQKGFWMEKKTRPIWQYSDFGDIVQDIKQTEAFQLENKKLKFIFCYYLLVITCGIPCVKMNPLLKFLMLKSFKFN